MTNTNPPVAPVAQGHSGGSWNRAAHEKLYGLNLNTGLGDFLAQEIAPKDFLEFGAGQVSSLDVERWSKTNPDLKNDVLASKWDVL
jgi:hypothetical protein